MSKNLYEEMIRVLNGTERTRALVVNEHDDCFMVQRGYKCWFPYFLNITLMQAITPRSIVTKKTISLRGLSLMFSQKTPFESGEIDVQQLRLGIVKMAQDDDDESVTP